MLKRNGWLAVVLAAVCVLAAGACSQDKSIRQIEPERKMALVIGNAAYAEAPLQNPVHDARAVAGVLREQLGFGEEHVELLENVASHEELTLAVEEFGQRLRETDVAFFYYAGHGMAVNRENYLLPTEFGRDGPVEEERVRFRALGEQAVRAALQPAQLRMIVLDACRNNPWTGKSAVQGLVPAGSVGEGELVAFAASPRQVVTDDGAGLGLYARQLVAALQEPGAEVRKVFDRVGKAVSAETEGNQQPRAVHKLLGVEFYFLPGAAKDEALPAREEEVEKKAEEVEKKAEAVRAREEEVEKKAEEVEKKAEEVEKKAAAVRAREEEVRAKEDVADPQDDGPLMPAAGSTWKSPLGMEFAWVPAGRFLRGELAKYGLSMKSLHEVRISQGFWMGVYEVTQEEWKAVMAVNPSDFKACGDRCPVENVSWEDVQDFIGKLNEEYSGKGYRYRLPTGAEWEYAARAGSAGHTPEGDVQTWFRPEATQPYSVPVLDEQAWHGGNSEVSYEGAAHCFGDAYPYMCGTHPVGMKRQNEWGLYDMLGNVAEFTGDWWGTYPSGAVTDPRGPVRGSTREVRGGDFVSAPLDTLSASRTYQFVNLPRSASVGFRLVRTMEEVADPQDDGPLMPAAGSTWKSPLGMEFAWVPAGRFLMGSPEGEEGRRDDELRHGVRISEGFWMGVYEVTQGEWEAVMGANPSNKGCGARCPVENVSWEDVQDFIGKLHERESGKGYRYRLPSEAEWEYAARAESTGATPQGNLRILGENNAPVLDGQAWYGGNSGVSDRAIAYECSDWPEKEYESDWCGVQPVGQKWANAWGLYDMLGNQMEWTGDWYGEYESGAVTDPQGPSTGFDRVVRGGSWQSKVRDVRSAARTVASPGERQYPVGFRLVRTK